MLKKSYKIRLRRFNIIINSVNIVEFDDALYVQLKERR
jgi:hypothetical protein